ncbi:MAG: carbohydrate kinase [Lachnospiraceae bacterium]|nr:carbohydrate kinase [Lachnospiraceae bacterium]
MSLLCIGEMLIDFTPLAGFPNSYTANPGGAPANVAVCAARNGVRTGFLGKLGNDDFGKMLAGVLRTEGVEMLVPKLTDEATTTMAFVTLDETGDRSFTFARKPGADLLLNEADVEGIDFSGWKILHAGSVSQSGLPERDAVLLAIRKARENGLMVSFDINYRDKIWGIEECRTEVDKVLPYVDLLKLSEEELCFVGGSESIYETMQKYGIAVIVLTKGKDGASVFFQGEQTDIPPVIAKAVDTTGAGDAFWGGFLSCLLQNGVANTEDLTTENLKAAAAYGTVAGSLCVQKNGGIPSLPTREEVEKKLL